MRFELFIAARYLRARRRQGRSRRHYGHLRDRHRRRRRLAHYRARHHQRHAGATSKTASSAPPHTSSSSASRPTAFAIGAPSSTVSAASPHVTAAAPGFYGQVLLSHGARSGGALVEGIIPQDQLKVGDLLQSIHHGSATELEPAPPAAPNTPPSIPPIVIGADLAETVGALVNDTVLITSPQGELTPLGLVPRYQKFRVVGIFSSGFYQYDAAYAFTRLTDAQRLFSEPDVISLISFKLDDLYRAREVAADIARVANETQHGGFETTNWMEQNRELFRALKLEQLVTFIVLALIVCVAALNILIALTMMVMEKTRDIAVLMSFGVTPGQIRRIFLLQGTLISLLGTVLGLALGYAASWAGGHYRFGLDPAVYSIDHLPFAPRLRGRPPRHRDQPRRQPPGYPLSLKRCRPCPFPLRLSAMSNSHTPGEVILRAENLGKHYAAISTGTTQPPVELFRNLNLEVSAGEMVAIVGQSGAGKSTLLHLLAALDRPSTGDVLVRRPLALHDVHRPGRQLPQPRDWLPLAVPLSAARVHRR